jgi:hypothetical protein
VVKNFIKPTLFFWGGVTKMIGKCNVCVIISRDGWMVGFFDVFVKIA